MSDTSKCPMCDKSFITEDGEHYELGPRSLLFCSTDCAKEFEADLWHHQNLNEAMGGW